MIERKKSIMLSIIATLLILGIGSIAFLLGEQIDYALTGKVTTTVYVQRALPAECKVALKEGMNFVSFFCQPSNENLDQALTNETNHSLNYTHIFSHTNNPDDPWTSYKKGLPNYTIQQLDTIDRYNSYYIYMNSSGNYSKTGFSFSSTTIPLKTGWNLVGYPSDYSKDITNALEDISGNYQRVESYVDDSWIYHTSSGGGTLKNMTPMHGYWIYVDSDENWVVNW